MDLFHGIHMDLSMESMVDTLVATIVYQIHMANASTEISLKPVKSMI